MHQQAEELQRKKMLRKLEFSPAPWYSELKLHVTLTLGLSAAGSSSELAPPIKLQLHSSYYMGKRLQI